MNKYIFTVFLLIGLFNLVCLEASPHKHQHSHNKERAEDGGFSPRDAEHFEDGEHHVDFDHEAILGSVKEAEEFDNLSPEESKRRLAILVRKMDLNGNQQIERHELKAWILRSFKTLSEEEAEDRFDDIDEDKDGKVTWREYIKDTYGMESEDELGKQHTIDEPHTNDEEKLVADDKEMFDAADINKNGYLTPEEFVKFHSPEEHPELLPIILKQTLRDKDKNNDGLIDFQEYVGDNAKNHDREWLLAEKTRFDDFDKDSDGVLNHNEILSWVVPSNDEVATDEVDHLFAAADDDHDNVLSYNEIIEKYDIFVGSEATDYGDHLQNIHHFADEL